MFNELNSNVQYISNVCSISYVFIVEKLQQKTLLVTNISFYYRKDLFGFDENYLYS